MASELIAVAQGVSDVKLKFTAYFLKRRTMASHSDVEKLFDDHTGEKQLSLLQETDNVLTTRAVKPASSALKNLRNFLEPPSKEPETQEVSKKRDSKYVSKSEAHRMLYRT